MAMNRVLYRSMQADVGVVDMDGQVDITGGSGAVAATSQTPGVTVVRDATGIYTFTVDEGASPRRFVPLFALKVAAQLYYRITALTLSSVTIVVETSAGADTDPADGDAIVYRFAYSNSSVVVP